jgi:hypothetical protein
MCVGQRAVLRPAVLRCRIFTERILDGRAIKDIAMQPEGTTRIKLEVPLPSARVLAHERLLALTSGCRRCHCPALG